MVVVNDTLNAHLLHQMDCQHMAQNDRYRPSFC